MYRTFIMILFVLFIPKAHAFDPFSFISAGVGIATGLGPVLGVAEGIGGALGAASDIADTFEAGAELYSSFDEDATVSDEGKAIQDKINEIQDVAIDMQYTQKEINSLFDSELRSSDTLADQIRSLTDIVKRTRKIAQALGSGSKKAQVATGAESMQIQLKSLEAQNAILYQVMSERLEEKQKTIGYYKAANDLLDEDRKAREKYATTRSFQSSKVNLL